MEQKGGNVTFALEEENSEGGRGRGRAAECSDVNAVPWPLANSPRGTVLWEPHTVAHNTKHTPVAAALRRLSFSPTLRHTSPALNAVNARK